MFHQGINEHNCFSWLRKLLSFSEWNWSDHIRVYGSFGIIRPNICFHSCMVCFNWMEDPVVWNISIPTPHIKVKSAVCLFQFSFWQEKKKEGINRLSMYYMLGIVLGVFTVLLFNFPNKLLKWTVFYSFCEWGNRLRQLCKLLKITQLVISGLYDSIGPAFLIEQNWCSF